MGFQLMPVQLPCPRCHGRVAGPFDSPPLVQWVELGLRFSTLFVSCTFPARGVRKICFLRLSKQKRIATKNRPKEPKKTRKIITLFGSFLFTSGSDRDLSTPLPRSPLGPQQHWRCVSPQQSLSLCPQQGQRTEKKCERWDNAVQMLALRS